VRETPLRIASITASFYSDPIVHSSIFNDPDLYYGSYGP